MQRNWVLAMARKGNDRVCRHSPRLHLSLLLRVMLFLATLLGSGCISVPAYTELRASNAVLPTATADIDVDGRSRFRDIFCTLAKNYEESVQRLTNNCEPLLWRLQDESPAGAEIALPALDAALQIFVVGGVFSDCFGAASRVFPHVIERLVDEGYPVSTLAISSRSSADYNARMIAADLVSAPNAPIVLVGYSKGAVDIAHFLVNYPKIAKRVAAVVSLAGPIMGSEIAAYGDWTYNTFFTDSFADRCPPGDGGVLDSLQPQVRRAWLSSHKLPGTVRYYTLLAFADRDHIARALLPTWDILASKDPRNDGQVTLSEGTWPNSTLLGYANADHWSIATEIETEFEFLASRHDVTPYPRGVLFEAALRYVSEDLRNHETPKASQDIAL
ncbi:MAG: hypothetical protein ABJ056_12720 [Halioglobus sp.]